MTIDCAALTIKSGNAIVLRGSSYAERSNGALAAIVREALEEAGLPKTRCCCWQRGRAGRTWPSWRLRRGTVDLLIPRGGEGLKTALKGVATVPVMYAAAGNCHVYVHDDADLEMARRIAYNAKVQRPGVCNAAETLLVNAQVAESFLPGVLADLRAAGVELVGDERAQELAGDVEVGAAGDEDWGSEYLDLKMVVGVVDSLEEAVEHINSHGTGHSEAIVTTSEERSRPLRRGRRRGCRLYERLDPLHRRLRVRDGRRDRQLDPEAARARADRPARADDLQVRRPRRRPGA